MNHQAAAIGPPAAVGRHDWSGRWITHPAWIDPPVIHDRPLPVLGLDVDLPDGVEVATLAFAGVGVVDVEVNGLPASPEVLAPGYATYARRIPARHWDLTHLLSEGTNRIRMLLGTGIAWVEPAGDRYTKLVVRSVPPRVLAQVQFTLPNGQTRVIGTDANWSVTDGPVLRSHWFGGEDADLRSTTWRSPITSDGWIAAADLGAADLHEPWWPKGPGLVVTERIRPVTRHPLADGGVLLDFGVNLAGWPVIHCDQATAGTVIEVWPSEVLTGEGRIDQRTTGAPLWDSVILADGPQTWHPRHVYHGFRYLEIRGDLPTGTAFEAWAIRAGNRPVGEFRTSDEFLNSLDTVIDRAVRGNMYSVFTDCPNREKLGWIEQLHLCFGTLTRSYDVEAQLRDQLQHLRDAQLATGLVPSIAPETVDFADHEYRGDPNAFRDDPNWGSAIVRLTELHYVEYGDDTVLTENWDAITRYLAYLGGRSKDGIVDFGLGDWIEPDEMTPTPRAMVATYGYLRALQSAGRIGGYLGRTAEAASLAARATRCLSAFRHRFSSDNGTTWGNGSQAGYALALHIGAVPAESTAAALRKLLQAIRAADNSVMTGEIGWPALVDVLHQHGRDDLILAMMQHPTRPGYAMQLRLGATSLAERWTGALGVDHDNSQNHFMLGMITDWMRNDVAGLRQAPGSIGWREALVRPTFVRPLRWASTAYESPGGRYRVEWSLDPSPRVVVDVPPQGCAQVELVSIDGRPFTSPLAPLAASPDRTDWVVPTGRWEFSL